MIDNQCKDTMFYFIPQGCGPQSCGMGKNRWRHIIESLADTGLRGFLVGGEDGNYFCQNQYPKSDMNLESETYSLSFYARTLT